MANFLVRAYYKPDRYRQHTLTQLAKAVSLAGELLDEPSILWLEIVDQRSGEVMLTTKPVIK